MLAFYSSPSLAYYWQFRPYYSFFSDFLELALSYTTFFFSFLPFAELARLFTLADMKDTCVWPDLLVNP